MKTFFMIKPDGVQRNLIGEIISRVEAKGFSITKIKMMTISKELAEKHYGEHKDKPFFNDLVSFITSGTATLERKRSTISETHSGLGKAADPERDAE